MHETAQRLSQMVIHSLRDGKAVEIEGLGIFYPDAEHGLRFVPKSLPKVFIAYVREDHHIAERLYSDLLAAGFNPWMDLRKLLPGQNWPRAIQNAIEGSDFFVACYSTHSVSKRGGFQAEIRYALDCARHVPLDEIFIVPLRLDHCNVPSSIRNELQYIDLFPDRERGLAKLIAMMRCKRFDH